MSLLDGLHTGVYAALEDQADAILREGRKGVTALSEKKDFLTDEQLALRQKREVYNSNGFPDPSICQGLYRRAYNPLEGRRAKGKGTPSDEW